MTNKEWTNLIAKEFNISNAKAKGILHSMYQAYYILTNTNRPTRKALYEDEVAWLRGCDY